MRQERLNDQFKKNWDAYLKGIEEKLATLEESSLVLIEITPPGQLTFGGARSRQKEIKVCVL